MNEELADRAAEGLTLHHGEREPMGECDEGRPVQQADVVRRQDHRSGARNLLSTVHFDPPAHAQPEPHQGSGNSQDPLLRCRQSIGVRKIGDNPSTLWSPSVGRKNEQIVSTLLQVQESGVERVLGSAIESATMESCGASDTGLAPRPRALCSASRHAPRQRPRVGTKATTSASGAPRS